MKISHIFRAPRLERLIKLRFNKYNTHYTTENKRTFHQVVSADLVNMIISAEECGYCGACVAVCPHGTLELEGMRIIQGECKNCTKCLIVCPVGAIKEGSHEV